MYKIWKILIYVCDILLLLLFGSFLQIKIGVLIDLFYNTIK